MAQSPEDTTPTLHEFRNAPWKAAVDSADHADPFHMSASLREAAQELEGASARVLSLLADVCSMALQPDSINEPFKAMLKTASGRSPLPEDFTVGQLSFLSEILPEIEQVWLRARIADLLWLQSKPRHPQHALEAIDAYRSTHIDRETWRRNGWACWRRALRLARQLGSGAGDRPSQMQDAIQSAFEAADTGDGTLALDLAELMEYRGGSDNALEVATKLESLGLQLRHASELDSARLYLDAAANWFRRSGEPARATRSIVAVAECWASEARIRESSSHMVAASLYENAIQTYRSIPRAERAEHEVDARITELHRRMNAAGARSIDEMRSIAPPPADLTELVERAQSAVRDKPLPDALLGLANVASGVDLERMRGFVERMIREHPLQALFSASHMSRDGRVVAKTKGMGPSIDPQSPDHEAAVWTELVKHYGIRLGITVQGSILPALDELAIQHRIDRRDIIDICRRSPIVPPGREGLLGTALFLGFEWEFGSAIHLLVPQVEHLVRYHLKAAGVRTTNLDQSGIENENGLSALASLPEVEQIFGKNVAFEIRALFCDAVGPNLRNAVAHGLLDDQESESIATAYAWWFALRLVCNTFWNAVAKPAAPTDA